MKRVDIRTVVAAALVALFVAAVVRALAPSVPGVRRLARFL